MQKKDKKNNYTWLIISLIILAIFLLCLKLSPFEKGGLGGIFKTFWNEKIRHEKQAEIKQEEVKSAAIYCLLDGSFKNSSSTEAVQEKIIKQCFHISEQGIILREAMLITGGPFLVIYGGNQNNLTIGQEVMKPQTLEFIAKIKNNFEKLKPENFPALSEFSLISPISNDIEILTANNWKIYMDASRDTDKQLEILFAAFKQKGEPKEYIDLRIEGKIYFK